MLATSLGRSFELGIVELSSPQAVIKAAERRRVLVRCFLFIFPHWNSFYQQSQIHKQSTKKENFRVTFCMILELQINNKSELKNPRDCGHGEINLSFGNDES